MGRMRWVSGLSHWAQVCSGVPWCTSLLCGRVCRVLVRQVDRVQSEQTSPPWAWHYTSSQALSCRPYLVSFAWQRATCSRLRSSKYVTWGCPRSSAVQASGAGAEAWRAPPRDWITLELFRSSVRTAFLTLLSSCCRPNYLLQLQLAGQPNAPPAGAAPADAAAAHLQLLQALGRPATAAAAASRSGAPYPLLGGGLPGSPGGLAAPRAVRLQDSQVPMSLSDFAVQLRKHAPAALPGSSGASAFSQPAGHGAAKTNTAAHGASSFDGGAAGATAGGGSAALGMHRQGSDGLKRQGSDSLRRQGSDSPRRGSSSSLPSSVRGTPGELLCGVPGVS